MTQAALLGLSPHRTIWANPLVHCAVPIASLRASWSPDERDVCTEKLRLTCSRVGLAACMTMVLVGWSQLPLRCSSIIILDTTLCT